MLSAIDTADRLARLRVEAPFTLTFEGLTTITELILDSPRQIPDALAHPSSVILTQWRRKAGSAEFIPTSSSNIIYRLVQMSRHVSSLITGGIFIHRALPLI